MSISTEPPESQTTIGPPVAEVFSFEDDPAEAHFFTDDHHPDEVTVIRALSALGADILKLGEQLQGIQGQQAKLPSMGEGTDDYEHLKSCIFEKQSALRRFGSAFAMQFAKTVKGDTTEHAKFSMGGDTYLANGQLFRLDVVEPGDSEDPTDQVRITVFDEMITQEQFNQGFYVASQADWEQLLNGILAQLHSENSG